MTMANSGGSAVIVVDVQRDFCAGGTLAANDTASLLQPLTKFIEAARDYGAIIFTQDWHPPEHASFKIHGGRWPVHCVAGSLAAELAPPLNALLADVIIKKGTSREGMGYSAFEETELAELLRQRGITHLGICGIATEYCVRATAMDAIRNGFKATLLTDLVRSVDASATEGVLSDISNAGIRLATSNAWLARRARVHRS